MTGLTSPAVADPDLPGPSPTPELIPAGSLVIAMDNDKQNLLGVFNLKAYGLVNDLLWSGIPVRWAIRAGKAKDGIDFSAPAQRIFPTVGAVATLDFRAGPFIVHRDWAGFAKLRIGSFGNSVAVYELTADATIDIRHKILQRRKVGILNDGGNVPIHRNILDAAGFVPSTQYVEIAAATLVNLNANTCITSVSEPHWDNTAIDTQAQAVRAFVQSNGNFLAQCVATLTYENNVSFGRFQTTAGIVEGDLSESYTFPNPDLPFSQFQGALADAGGSVQDIQLAPGSSFRPNTHTHVRDTPTTAAFAATAGRLNPAGPGSLVMYLAGHSYNGSDIASLNGQRMYLNWTMIPSVRPPACGFTFVDDPSGLRRITGRVLEDVDGDGGLLDAVGASGARVRVYSDTNGNGLVDAGDTPLGTALTTGGGVFDVQVNPAATGNAYLLAVDSRSIVPSAGINAGSAIGDVWAEQTYGDNPATPALDLGLRFGGTSGTVSDAFNTLSTAPTAGTYEHVARVSVGSGDVSGVDFAFSFNIVTSVRGGDNADDDSSSNRTVQGSLRQLVQNANAIVGANAMRFVPAVPTNASGGGGSWWSIPVTSDLPAVRDTGTAIRGTAYSAVDGTTVRDDNPGVLGTGGTVGADATALAQLARPELEILNGSNRKIGLDLQAADASVIALAVRAFGSNQDNDGDAQIRVGAFANAVIRLTLVGTRPDAFTTQTDPDTGDGIRVVGGDNGRVESSLVGFVGGNGIALRAGADGWTIEGNEIRGNAANASDLQGVLLETSSGARVAGNLIADHRGEGIDMASPTGAAVIASNSILRNGVSGTQTSGVRVFGTGTLVDRNEIFDNRGAGVLVASTATGNRITRNAIRGNGTLGTPTGQIGIDLIAATDDVRTGTAPFVTLNDAGDVDSGGNGLLNTPVLASADIVGADIVVAGFARPGSTVELFVTDLDPSGFGEGKAWIGTFVEGSPDDSDATTGTYGPAAINGIVQGRDTTNRFRFTFPIPTGVVSGTPLTATATLAGATSEFSARVTTAPVHLDGAVVEDPGGDADLADRVPRPGVLVRAYRDGGDGLPDGVDDTLAGSATTDAAGAFALHVSAGLQWVMVDSRMVTPSAGLAGSPSEVWAEQSVGPRGAWCADGSGGVAVRASAGPCFGGRRADVSDNASALASAEHVAQVDASSGDVNGIEFAFSFDAVTSTRGGDNADDDGAALRTVQGSLRQFLQNAAAITGPNSMRFVPAAPPNATGAGGSWWRIPVTVDLPDVRDAGTKIDGTAYQLANGIAPRDDNPGVLGTGGTVGVEATAVPTLPRPELEVADAANRRIGLDLQAADATVRRISIRGFGTQQDRDTDADIRIGAVANARIDECIVGTGPDAFAAQAETNNGDGIRVVGGDAGRVDRSLVGFCGGNGIALSAGADGWTIESSEIRGNGTGDPATGGVKLEASAGASVRGNRIHDNRAEGVGLASPTGPAAIERNTIARNGAGGTQTAGVRLLGSQNLVDRNEITQNQGAGVLVTSSSSRNKITRNSIHLNGTLAPGTGQIGIDLLAGPNNQLRGTSPFFTLNDSGDGDNGGNALLNEPVLESAALFGGNLTVTGWARPGSVVEVFLADVDPSSFGEGKTWIATVTEGSAGDGDAATSAYGPGAINGVPQGTDTTSRFSFNVPVTTLGAPVSPGAYLTGTATDASDATSEFSAVVRVTGGIADLSITKTDGIASAVPGTPITYTIRVTNLGPAPSSAAAVTDTLDPAVFDVAAASWTCAITTAGSGPDACAAPGPVSGNVATTVDLSVGAVATITVTAPVLPGATGTIANTASVAAISETDSTPANNTATDGDTALAPAADLSLSMTADTTAPAFGATVTFTLTATNDGPSDASGVTVTDPLPPGLTFVSDDGGGSYSAASGVWSIGTLPRGASAVLHLQARMDSAVPLTNVAEVTSSSASDPDSTPGNGAPAEDDRAEVALAPVAADLSLAKTVDVAAPDVGSNVVFTLTVKNDGPSPAGSVLVADLLPAGFTHVGTTGTGTYDPTFGVWNVGPLAVGSSASIQITARAIADGTYENVAEVAVSDAGDPDSTPGNGSRSEDDLAAVTVTILRVADLSLTKSVDNPTPDVGAAVTFTLTLANAGPGPASGVEVRDLLPSGTTYVSDDGGGAYDSGSGLWTVGTIASGASATLQLQARVEPTGSYVNVAEVSHSEATDPDSTPGNGVPAEDDFAQASLVPRPVADLSLTKSVDDSSPDVGTTVTFTLTLANAGPSAASGVRVADLLPNGYAYVSDDGAGAYVPGTGIWTAGGVPASGSTVLQVVGRVLPSGNYLNVAEVSASDQHDPDSTPGNAVSGEDDHAQSSTAPGAVSDLSIAKSVDVAGPDVGSNVTFTLQVSNAGPSPATGVVVLDLLPNGYAYVSDDGAGAYVPGTGVWTAGAIPIGGTATLHVVARVLASGNTTNVAEIVAADPFDPDSTPGNGAPGEDDYAQRATTPGAVADLSLSKSVDVPSPDVGANVSFTLTLANAGPSSASGIVVRDLLPSGYAYVSDDGAGAYDSSGGAWTVGAIPLGGSSTLHIVGRVLASGTYANVAEVVASDAGDPDSTPGNAAAGEDDYASATTTPHAVADLSLTKTVDAATPDVGTNVTFTLTVASAGPSAATGVRVSDLLPSGYAYVSDDGGGAYERTTGVWTVGAVPAGGSRVLHLVGRVLPSGAYANVAEIAASDANDPDSTPGNGATGEDDYAQSATVPSPVADLSLAKTVDAAAPNVGTNVTFTLTLANAGPSAASGVSVTDLLPSGYAYVGDDGAGAYAAGTGAWSVGTVASGASRVLHVVARVLPTGNYLNVAEVTASGARDPDSTPGNAAPGEDDSAQRATTPGAVADLSITKSDGVPSYTPGGTLTYTIVVSNAGPSAAAGVAVQDAPLALPQVASASWTCAAAGGATCAAGPVVGDLADTISIPAGGTATYTVQVALRSSASGDLVNAATVSVSAGTTDPDPAGNVATDTDTRGTLVHDLSITKTDAVTSYTPGATVTYTIVVSNAGPSDATGVVVHDAVLALPQVASASWTCAGAGGATCTPGPVAGDIDDTIAVPVGGTATYTLRVTLEPDASGDLVNAATAAGSGGSVDPVPGNGTASDTDARGAPVADLRLVMSADETAPALGGRVVFTLAVSNAGPSTATGIVVRDILPAGMRFISDDGGGALDPGTGLWTLTQPLAPGSTAALAITVEVDTHSVHAAEIAAANEQDPDSTPGNGIGNGEDDQASQEIFPDATRTLAIVKSVDRTQASIGRTVGYAVTIRNVQAFDVADVRIEDAVPPGFAYVQGTARLGGVPIPDPVPGRPLVFTIGTIAAGQEVVLTYRLIVGAGARPGPATNRAVATTPAFTVSQEARVTVEVRLDPTFDLGTIIGKVFRDDDGDGVQDAEEPGAPGVRVALDDGTYAVTDEFGRYHLPALVQGRRALKIDVNSLPGGATVEEPVRIVWLTPGLMVQEDFAVGFEVEAVTIGSEPRPGLAVGADDTALPIEVRGNADTLSVFVNGEPVLLNTGDARIGLATLAPILTVSARKLAEPIVFMLDTPQKEKIDRWELTVRKRDGPVVKRGNGSGPPPRRLEWSGDDDNGELVLEQGVYEYFLNATWKDGTESRGPVRYFGVNVARVISVRLTGEAFESGRAELSPRAKEILHEAAETLRRHPREDVVIEGHTDSVGGSRANVELSRQRAEAALRQLVDVEKLPAERFSVHAYGEERPVASNDTEEGRALNRRIEVKGDHEEVDESGITDVYRHPPYLLVDGMPVKLGTTHQFSHAADSAAPKLSIEAADSRGQLVRAEVPLPLLSVAAPKGRFVVPEGGAAGGCRSSAADGAAPLTCRVAGTVDPGSTLEVDGRPVEVAPDGAFAVELPLPAGAHAASLLARNPAGYRRVVELKLHVSDKDEAGQRIEVDAGIPSLTVQLPPDGTKLKSATLPVRGKVEPGVLVAIDGKAVTVAPDGTFDTAVKLPPGTATMTIEATDAAGRIGTIERSFQVPKNEMFLLAFAEGSVGWLQGSGFLEGAGLTDTSQLYTQGRLAYYLKGVVAGKYLITSALDTAKESGGSLLADVDGEQSRRLLTNLDPDKYYPVYGDAGDVVYDAESQGKFYLAVDSDEIHALIGDYPLALTDTELASYQRTLYGGRFVYQSAARTLYGDPDTQVVVFGAEVKNAHVHDQLLATGGSLYYLSHRDIVEGSETVTIVTRDKNTGLQLHSQRQQAGADYTIKYEEGRIVFHRPIQMVEPGGSIVDQAVLQGNPVYVLIDYETILSGFDETGYGARARQQIGDHLAVGGTYVKDQLGGGEYTLSGLDAEIKLGAATRIVTEAADSSGRNANVFASQDGGLTYAPAAPAGQNEGTAWKIAADVDVGEWFGAPGRYRARAYYKDIEPGFFANGTLLDQAPLQTGGIGSRQGSTKMGADAEIALTAKDKIHLRYDRDEHTGTGGGGETVTTAADWTRLSNRWGIAVELFDTSSTGAATLPSRSYAAARYWTKLGEKITARFEHQQTLSGPANDRTAAGIEYQALPNLALEVLASDGSLGSSAQAGVVYTRGESSVYLTERFAQDQAGERTSTVLGARSPIGKDTRVYTEYQWEDSSAGGRTISLAGLQRQWDPTPGLKFLVSGEAANVHADTGDTKRTALAAGVTFDSGSGLRAFSRQEIRIDEGAGRRRQYVTVNQLDSTVSPDLTLLARWRFSRTENRDSGAVDADFDERVLGAAYRPVRHQRFNALFKYTSLAEQHPAGGATPTAGPRKSDVLSIDTAFRATPKLEWLAKEAARVEDESGVRSTSFLIAQRLNFDLWKRAGFGVEYRLLEQRDGGGRRQGWLAEGYWRLQEHVRFGIGYDWTDFSDDGSHSDDYEARGLFLRVQGTY